MLGRVEGRRKARRCRNGEDQVNNDCCVVGAKQAPSGFGLVGCGFLGLVTKLNAKTTSLGLKIF
jgi:hypothetical protein